MSERVPRRSRPRRTAIGRRRWLMPGLLTVVGVVGAGAVPAARAAGVPQIYWADSIGQRISSANIDGAAGSPSLITGANAPGGVAVDGHSIYWANQVANTIGVANLDGSGANQSLVTGAHVPTGIAVGGGHIFWANAGDNTIGEANLDGTGVNESFVTGANLPMGVAVDGRHVYWTNQGNDTIGEAHVDGSSVNESFINAAAPMGIAVNDRHLYWINSASGTIGKANLDGGGVEESFVTVGGTPWGVAVDAQHIYWTTGSTGSIGEADINGTNVNPALITGTGGSALGVAVSVPAPAVSPATPPGFPSTQVDTLSAPQTLTLTNEGRQALSLTGLSFGGTDPGDFIVSANTCLAAIDPGLSCQVTVAFAPTASGPRSATLLVAGNDYANGPLAVALHGAGVAPVAGGVGPTGPVGPVGRTGATGLRGPAGKVELVTCKTVTTTVHHKRRTHKSCTVRLVSGTVSFTTATAAVRASLARGGIVYAAGASVGAGRGSVLVLSGRRPLRRGRYTLTLTRRGALIRRQTITIS